MGKMSIKELTKELSPEDLSDLDAAASLSPVFDDDSPEMIAEMLLQFKRVRHAEHFPDSQNVPSHAC